LYLTIKQLTTVSQQLHSSTCFSQHPQLRTGGFYCSKAILLVLACLA